MIWLDHVLSSPLVGIRFRTRFGHALSYLSRISPVLDALQDEGLETEFQARGVADIRFQLSDGRKVRLDEANLIVQQLRSVEEGSSAADPRESTTPVDPPYTEALSRILDLADSIGQAVFGEDGLEVQRIGVLVRTRMALSDPPPGVAQWIEDLQRPWADRALSNQADLLLLLDEQDAWYDRCHHKLALKRGRIDPSEVCEFQVDWQRLFHHPTRERWQGLAEQLATCRHVADAYFEAVGKRMLD